MALPRVHPLLALLAIPLILLGFRAGFDAAAEYVGPTETVLVGKEDWAACRVKIHGAVLKVKPVELHGVELVQIEYLPSASLSADNH